MKAKVKTHFAIIWQLQYTHLMILIDLALSICEVLDYLELLHGPELFNGLEIFGNCKKFNNLAIFDGLKALLRDLTNSRCVMVIRCKTIIGSLQSWNAWCWQHCDSHSLYNNLDMIIVKCLRFIKCLWYLFWDI